MTNADGIAWRMLQWSMAKRIDRAVAKALLTPLAETPPRPNARRARIAAVTRGAR